ncbi:MAG: hypothetical protein KAR33_01190 [Candidatus Thorarchaeota archaeon]|nr:hypothetical protein [Candidatus Thorarchaeota archaeon]
MTPTPRLRLVCHPPSRPEHTPLHVDTDRAQLWELVNDEDVHLILRVPGLIELARRRDSDVLNYCKRLIDSGNSEEWYLGIKAIAAIGTPESIDKLLMIYASSLNDNRKYITGIVAQTLTVDYVHPFTIMLRELAVPGEIDITGWTSTAVTTLQDVCKRRGIETEIEGVSQSSHNRMLEVDSDLVDTTIISK